MERVLQALKKAVHERVARPKCFKLLGSFPITFFLQTMTTSNKCEMLNNLKFVNWKGPVGESLTSVANRHPSPFPL